MSKPILTEEWFYRRRVPREESPPCVCRDHTIIVVVRKPSGYWMRNVGATEQGSYFHHWKKRTDDPTCLAMFEPDCLVPVAKFAILENKLQE